MKPTTKKAIAAAAIWATVCALGWNAWVNVLPMYGFRRVSSGRPRTNEEWNARYQQLQAAAEAFHGKSMPSETSVRLARSADEAGVRGMPYVNGRETHGASWFAENYTILDIYAQMSGLPRWRLSMPAGHDGRWNLQMKKPATDARRAEVVLLETLGWRTAERLDRVQGWALSDGTPPVLEPQPASRFSWTLPPITLREALASYGGFLQAPVRIDDSVKERKLDTSKKLEMSGRPDAEIMLKQLAAAYSVSLGKEDVVVTTTLLYHPSTAVEVVEQWKVGGSGTTNP